MPTPRQRPPVPTLSTRPWGQFVQFVSGEDVTVKVMTVLPGHRLSLQRHGHRAEYWYILDPGIRAWVDDVEQPASPGDSVWVGQGSVHRIGNFGDAPARVLELAFGDFDEADIERLDDDYAR